MNTKFIIGIVLLCTILFQPVQYGSSQVMAQILPVTINTIHDKEAENAQLREESALKTAQINELVRKIVEKRKSATDKIYIRVYSSKSEIHSKKYIEVIPHITSPELSVTDSISSSPEFIVVKKPNFFQRMLKKLKRKK